MDAIGGSGLTTASTCNTWASRARALAMMSAMSFAGPACAAWTYSLDFLDMSSDMLVFKNDLSSNIGSALGLWTRHLAGGAALEIEVVLTNEVPRAAGGSITSGLVRNEGPLQVYEQGVAYEIRTGMDPNGSKADLRIEIGKEYLLKDLWFDPEPARRSTAVLADKIDAVSVFAHEIGHALAFNGWWNEPQARWQRGFGSTWDLLTYDDGSLRYFTGARAMSLYGGPVPVTTGNNKHIGNSVGAGSDLLGDLMNGVAFEYGARYDVSPLNLEMLADMGIGLATVPEPPTGLLLAAGLAGLLGFGRLRAGGRVNAACPAP
jgi:hypothetical protein